MRAWRCAMRSSTVLLDAARYGPPRQASTKRSVLLPSPVADPVVVAGEVDSVVQPVTPAFPFIGTPSGKWLSVPANAEPTRPSISAHAATSEITNSFIARDHLLIRARVCPLEPTIEQQVAVYALTALPRADADPGLAREPAA